MPEINTITIKVNPTAIISGQKSVTTAGTAVALSSNTSTIKAVMIKANSGNTNNIYVGNDGAGDVSSSNGYILAAGEEIIVYCDSLTEIYLDADTNGEGVSYIAYLE